MSEYLYISQLNPPNGNIKYLLQTNVSFFSFFNPSVNSFKYFTISF